MHRACFYSGGQKFIMAYGIENKETGKIDFDMRASPLNGFEYRENFEFFIESINKKNIRFHICSDNS